ncbi:pilin [Candidatus Parcubacteria bacterium]|nr:pilin [Candidatus Parcubacteria bacterium]
MERLFLFIISLCLIISTLFLPTARVIAVEDYVLLAPISKEIGPSVKSNELPKYIGAMYKIIVGLSGVLAVLSLVVGGFMYISAESFGKKTNAKAIILRSLWGLVLILGSALILQTINPELLNLNRIYDSLNRAK